MTVPYAESSHAQHSWNQGLQIGSSKTSTSLDQRWSPPPHNGYGDGEAQHCQSTTGCQGAPQMKLCVSAEPKEGGDIYIRCSPDWSRGYPMHPGEKPNQYYYTLPILEKLHPMYDVKIEYKYVCCTKEGRMWWESGKSNRTLTPSTKQTVVHDEAPVWQETHQAMDMTIVGSARMAAMERPPVVNDVAASDASTQAAQAHIQEMCAVADARIWQYSKEAATEAAAAECAKLRRKVDELERSQAEHCDELKRMQVDFETQLAKLKTDAGQQYEIDGWTACSRAQPVIHEPRADNSGSSSWFPSWSSSSNAWDKDIEALRTEINKVRSDLDEHTDKDATYWDSIAEVKEFKGDLDAKATQQDVTKLSEEVAQLRHNFNEKAAATNVEQDLAADASLRAQQELRSEVDGLKKEFETKAQQEAATAKEFLAWRNRITKFQNTTEAKVADLDERFSSLSKEVNDDVDNMKKLKGDVDRRLAKTFHIASDAKETLTILEGQVESLKTLTENLKGVQGEGKAHSSPDPSPPDVAAAPTSPDSPAEPEPEATSAEPAAATAGESHKSSLPNDQPNASAAPSYAATPDSSASAAGSGEARDSGTAGVDAGRVPNSRGAAAWSFASAKLLGPPGSAASQLRRHGCTVIPHPEDPTARKQTMEIEQLLAANIGLPAEQKRRLFKEQLCNNHPDQKQRVGQAFIAEAWHWLKKFEEANRRVYMGDIAS